MWGCCVRRAAPPLTNHPTHPPTHLCQSARVTARVDDVIRQQHHGLIQRAAPGPPERVLARQRPSVLQREANVGAR